ncbi:FAD-binding and (Fe-S)-binding domain-containing protein [Labilibaculum sp. K2S]|uniref:FAD-binding and (Fe-S)-binding domain-containing protein n=1 Tax=Labilibaculum sp. K2S TaxID=3056386 RepID=UPI0025A47AAD|nr:FAD-binding and (Fe-S)-binding domain-containing protein [Labilibaculum sp. K2S]MDM8159847.1 FAD-binding and (Fe-S)-binding domain-containing protein [Labilibaculum sp. K2S]
MLTGEYKKFYHEIKATIETSRLYTDEIRNLAYGTDAGFYRLIPQIIIRAKDEKEVQKAILLANKYNLPVTFRAAGTSLAGQAITDSILIVAGKHWEDFDILKNGEAIRMQPGLIGSRVNKVLAPYGRKLGPDPASINSAMIGGIVMNNASGMNCGTHENSYKTILSARLIFADGTILDTGDSKSKEEFKKTHGDFIRQIEAMRDKVRANKTLAERIRYKYSIKNTTGLSINPFIDYTDPFQIIVNLMVGSEGTLAFVSELTMKTVVNHKFKASAMIYFSDIVTACQSVVTIKPGPVHGAEMLDRVALRSVENADGIPPFIKDFPDGVTAILVETLANSQSELDANINEIKSLLSAYKTVRPIEFTDKPEEYSKYWNIRKGVFPAVGGLRETGTTCIIEDVAFHIEDLPKATLDLQNLIAKYGYKDGVIYGHALEGNFHFIFNQNFDKPEELEQYKSFMHEVDELVIDKYDGSLKAEHGTGRNMAPFVKHEWGEEAYQLMKDVKNLFDPKTLLNPGVIINDDPECYTKNFKTLAPVHDLVDKCIECGFCEVNCLTAGFTISARQRIVVQRELKRLQITGENPERYTLLKKGFDYLGEETCAGDGLCSTSCPVGIDTGKFVKYLRSVNVDTPRAFKISQKVADNFPTVGSAIRGGLKFVNGVHTVMGSTLLGAVAGGFRTLSGNNIPLWTPAMPKGVSGPKPHEINQKNPLKVVYFPSCIAQTMGPAKGDPYKESLHKVTQKLLEKAGYEVIFPEGMSSLCCGTPWESKGLIKHADQKSSELEDALTKASENGKYPVLCDTSPCLYRMRRVMDKRLKLYEPVEFIHEFLMDKLVFQKVNEVVAVHPTCTTTKMGLTSKLQAVAEACAQHVVLPEEVGCCGFAGDRGFNFPEVNKYALRKLRPVLDQSKVVAGYSNSRTCEIGLSNNGGVPYMSIIYLVDRVTTAKK